MFISNKNIIFLLKLIQGEEYNLYDNSKSNNESLFKELFKIMNCIEHNFHNSNEIKKNMLVLNYYKHKKLLQGKGKEGERERTIKTINIFDKKKEFYGRDEEMKIDEEILIDDKNSSSFKNFLVIKKREWDGRNTDVLDINKIFKLPKEHSDFNSEMFNKIIIERDFLLDSRDTADPENTNNLTINIGENIKNIISITLKNALLSTSDYLINSSNNLLHFQESSNEVLTATITEGNYSASELITEIQTQMNNTGSSTYTVSSDNYSALVDTPLTGPSSLVTQNYGDGWKVFDTSYDNFWLSNLNSGYITYNFSRKVSVQKYTLLYTESTYGYPSDWTVEVSDDNINWIIIDTQVNQVFSQYQTKEYTIVNNYLAKKYTKLNITESSTTGQVHLSILNYFEFIEGNEYISITSDLTGGDNLFYLLFEGTNNIKYGEDRFISSYRTNSIGEMIGFSPINLTLNNRTYIGQNQMLLERPEFIYLCIKDINLVQETMLSTNTDIFSKIFLSSGDITEYSPTSSSSLKEDINDSIEFNGPIILRKLNIQFKYKNGSLYNFRGKSYSLLFSLKIFNF